MRPRNLAPASLFAAAAVALAVAPAARGAVDLRFTEVMSSSGTGGTADWVEVTNFGDTAADVSGYKLDDGSFSFGASVPLAGTTSIAAGKSVVFVETTTTAPADEVAAFRTFWGLSPDVSVGYYEGSGAGVSLGSGGDGVVLFTGSGSTAIPALSFGAATSGKSFGYNPVTSTFGGLSEAGKFGAFESANALKNVGSPGAVPEPTAAAGILLATGLLGLRRRAR